ncbi:MAG: acyltransferase, partial [Desulfobacterales bacterium]|nr:acyltransferase [Desulfobacterales bacterium]
FISGMFVWQSLAKKGIKKYLTGRFTRLGIPFIFGVFFLIPLAYYPAQIQVGLITGTYFSYGEFWLGMIRSGFGTAGPFWFLWLLLAFNTLVALLCHFFPFIQQTFRRQLTIVIDRPLRFSIILIGISILVYLPVTIATGPLAWIGIGPFHVQVSRVLLYLFYFLLGIGIGAFGSEPNGLAVFARYWVIFMTVGMVSFIVFIIMVAGVTNIDLTIISSITFVICCGANVFGITGFFLWFTSRRFKLIDSLSRNAYGIYIVHYGFVTWLQYMLLQIPLAPGTKGMLVFLTALMLSWGTSAVLRRIPAVKKII